MPPKSTPAAPSKRQRPNPPPTLSHALAPAVSLSPLPTPPPTAPPMSAVAARRAALALLAPPPSSSPSASGSSSEDEEEEEEEDVLNLEQPDSSAEEEGAAEAQLEKRRKRQAKTKVKNKSSGRYFGGEPVEGERERVGVMDVDVTETLGGLEEPEVREKEEGKGKGKMGRGKRQRRERSAFMDPGCVSGFEPRVGENAFNVQFERDGRVEDGLLLCLRAGDTLVIHGSYNLLPVFGSISLLGAQLSAPSSSTSSIPLLTPTSIHHRVFSPSSHPLPSIESLQLPLNIKTTSLSLPSGQSIDLSAYSSVVLLSSLNSEIEGVEVVLRSGGMGCGNGMWEVPLSTLGTGANWGGVGWQLIVDPTHSLTSLRMLDSWSSTLAFFDPPISRANLMEEDGEEEEVGSSRTVLIVEGPKRVGKSTFAKLLLNRLLSRYERVAYLDTDLGQPEFTAPGLVSLSVLDQPVFGPSFTHPSLPVASHFIGSTSPASNPSSYLSAISSLLSTYTLEVEYPLVEDTPRHRNRSNPTTRLTKIRDHIPLVINTQGWVKGLGADLLEKLKSEAAPTHLFRFEVVDENGTSDFNDSTSWHAESLPYQVYKMEPAPASPLDSKWSAADLRTLSMISYFHALFPPPLSSSSLMIHTNVFPSTWDFSSPLVEKVPYAVDWTNEEEIKSVHILDAEIPYSHVLHALNGEIVALVTSTSDDNDSSVPRSSTTSKLPYSPYDPLPLPSHSRTLALALIRSIDPTTTTFHILTPLHPSSLTSPLSLIKGSLELPLSLMLDFKASEEEREKGVKGVGWEGVPYLSVGEGEGGRKKVRRNLMRRGQAGQA